MKQLIFFFLGSLILFAQTPPRALEYLEAMGNNQEKIAYETWDYISALARSNDFRQVQTKHKQVFNSVATTLNKAEQMPDFNGSSRLRDSMVSYLKFSLDVMTGHTQELIDMETLAKKSYDKMEAYVFYRQELNAKMQAKSKMMQNEQRIFAKENDIELIETESAVSQKIATASKLFNYRDLMYLSFYRCAVYEELMLANIRIPDSDYDYRLVALTVSDLADASRSKLDTITNPVATDNRLKEVTTKALLFFEEEAQDLLPVVRNYWQTRNDFETYQKKYKEIAPAYRTQNDVNKYNQLVADLNKRTTDLNSVQDTYNKRRAAIFEEWNKIADAYINEHTPR